MTGGWFYPLWLQNLLGGGTVTPTPDIGVHINSGHFQSDATTTIATQASLDPITLAGDFHAHGSADLTVDSVEFANPVNCMVSYVDGPLLPATFDAGTLMDFSLRITPADFGPYSFDAIFTSDDPDQPVLTITFEGVAVDQDTVPTQADIGWTATNRRLEWTSV